MSWQALNWVSGLNLGKGKSSHKFVLFVLANHADEHWTCYPGVPAISKETELSQSTIYECLKWLVEDGKVRVLQRWWSKTRAGRKSSRYQLLPLGPDTPMPEVDDWTHEYKHTPRAKGDEGDEGDSPAGDDLGPDDDHQGPTDDAPPGDHEPADETTNTDGDGPVTDLIPPESGGLESADLEPDASGFWRLEPPDSGGLNLRILEASPNKEVTTIGEPSLGTNPPLLDGDSLDATDQAATGTDNDQPRFDEPTRALLTGALEEVLRLRAGWGVDEVRAAMLEALDDGRQPVDVARAIVAVATDRATQVPGRLNTAGPWWNHHEPIRDLRPGDVACSKHPGWLAKNCAGCRADVVAERADAAAARPPVQPAGEESEQRVAARAAAAAIAARFAKARRRPDVAPAGGTHVGTNGQASDAEQAMAC